MSSQRKPNLFLFGPQNQQQGVFAYLYIFCKAFTWNHHLSILYHTWWCRRKSFWKELLAFCLCILIIAIKDAIFVFRIQHFLLYYFVCITQTFSFSWVHSFLSY